MGHSAAAFVVVIGILVFCHELGHFLAARLCKVGVDVFSLGFGPKLFKKKIGRTEYCVSAIPLGGYVKMVGEEPGTTIDPKDESLSFTHKSLLQKSIIVAAGPAFNFILSLFIFYVLYQFSGIYMATPVVGKVLENTPAHSAGFKPGDIIKEINHKPILTVDDYRDAIREIKKDEAIRMYVRRMGGGHLILKMVK
jgi:regulator of sigma E protease